MPESTVKQPKIEIRKAHRQGNINHLWMYLRSNYSTRQETDLDGKQYTIHEYREAQVKVPINIDERLPDVANRSADQNDLKRKLHGRFLDEPNLRGQFNAAFNRAKHVDRRDKEKELKEKVLVDVSRKVNWGMIEKKQLK